jgi:DNA replication and repair protein RecF
MQLTHLSLTNFRNFVRLETDAEAGPTLLFGANAQGKTSLLEAIYYLTAATSPHTTSDRQLINFLALEEPTPYARIVAEYRRGDRLGRIEIRLSIESDGSGTDGRLAKEILINGVKRRVGDLAGAFNAVLFLPQDLKVIEGSPGDRRRHLDATLSQADPLYAESLSHYARLLSQRNALLKQIAERGAQQDELSYWDEQLTAEAASLIRSRALALRELEAAAEPIHNALTRGQEHLRLVYEPSYDPLPQPPGQMGLAIDTPVDRTGLSRDAIQQGMRQALEQGRGEEIARGITLIGPHRDDVRFQVNALDLHTYGSRGQVRTAMLALKLAEVGWLKQRTGEWPVLLLDEVLAELDANRREDLLARIKEAQQAIVTSADLDMFSPAFLADANLWQVSAGNLTPVRYQASGDSG